MATTYRIKYCPPNPGWNSRKLKENRWFTSLKDLQEYVDSNPSVINEIWVSNNGKKFVKFNYNEIV